MRRFTKALLLALLAITVIAVPVLAYTFRATYTVAESGNVSYDMYLATCNVSNQWMADNGFFKATALDTRVETLAGGTRPHMVVDDRTLAATPLSAYSQANLYFTTGNSDLTTMDIIVGYDGYITASDDATLELGDNFTIETSLWVDTDNGTDKNLVDKDGVFSVFVSPTVSENITATIWGANTTVNLVPNGAGDYTNIAQQFPATTFHWDKVDDPPATPDDDATRVYTASEAWQKDAYELEDLTISPDSIINSVTVYYRYEANTETDQCFAQPFLRLNGNETEGTADWTAGAYKDVNETLARPGGGSWTFEDINDLQVAAGLKVVSRTVDYSTLTQIYVQVNYNPPISVTATNVASGEHTVKVTGELTLDFDGVTDRIVIPAATQQSGYAEMSLEIRGRIDGAGSAATQTLIMKEREAANDSYSMFTPFATRTFYSKWIGVDAQATHISTANWTLGEWFYAVTTYDGANIKFFLDGVYDGQTPLVGGIVKPNPTIDLYLGCYYTGATNELHGSIVEAKIYSRVLTPAEIAQRANGYYADESNLVAHYAIDEGTGTNIVDSTAYGNDGTAIGTSWDTTELKLYIDDAFCDIDVLGTVPNTSADWTFLDNSTTFTVAYTDNMTIDIGGVERLYYAPNSMIIGTNLPDRSDNSNNGTFHWGNNPSGVAVTLGSMYSSYQPGIGETLDEPSQDIMHDIEVSDWFAEPDVSGTLLTNPIRPFITIMSDTTNMTELQAWRFFGLLLVLAVTVGTASKVRGHMGIAGVACGVSIGLLVAWTIWPLWALTFAIAGIIAGLIMERSPSL